MGKILIMFFHCYLHLSFPYLEAMSYLYQATWKYQPNRKYPRWILKTCSLMKTSECDDKEHTKFNMLKWTTSYCIRNKLHVLSWTFLVILHNKITNFIKKYQILKSFTKFLFEWKKVLDILSWCSKENKEQLLTLRYQIFKIPIFPWYWGVRYILE